MLGNFFAGFEKRAEEKKKRSAAATGAMIGGGLGALPGATILGAAGLAHLMRRSNPKIKAMAAAARRKPTAGDYRMPAAIGAFLAGTGGAAGAGAGGLAGGAVDLARKHRKKD